MIELINRRSSCKEGLSKMVSDSIRPGRVIDLLWLLPIAAVNGLKIGIQDRLDDFRRPREIKNLHDKD